MISTRKTFKCLLNMSYALKIVLLSNETLVESELSIAQAKSPGILKFHFSLDLASRSTENIIVNHQPTSICQIGFQDVTCRSTLCRFRMTSCSYINFGNSIGFCVCGRSKKCFRWYECTQNLWCIKWQTTFKHLKWGIFWVLARKLSEADISI